MISQYLIAFSVTFKYPKRDVPKMLDVSSLKVKEIFQHINNTMTINIMFQVV